MSLGLTLGQGSVQRGIAGQTPAPAPQREINADPGLMRNRVNSAELNTGPPAGSSSAHAGTCWIVRSLASDELPGMR